MSVIFVFTYYKQNISLYRSGISYKGHYIVSLYNGILLIQELEFVTSTEIQYIVYHYDNPYNTLQSLQMK